MPSPALIHNMALFCDFENVALGVADAEYPKFDIRRVMERLLLKGSIVVKKAYCDWDRYKAFKRDMHEAAFELIEIPHVRQSGKNSADIRMVVDALDLCYTKAHVDCFVIISGDSDFSPLVSKLRENNKKVIGVGVRNSTSDLLIGNCDEFIFYDDLVLELQETRRKRAERNQAQAAQPAARGGASGAQPSARNGAANGAANGAVAATGAGKNAQPAKSGQPAAKGGRAVAGQQAATSGSGRVGGRGQEARSGRGRRGRGSSEAPAAPMPSDLFDVAADEAADDDALLAEQAANDMVPEALASGAPDFRSDDEEDADAGLVLADALEGSTGDRAAHALADQLEALDDAVEDIEPLPVAPAAKARRPSRKRGSARALVDAADVLTVPVEPEEPLAALTSEEVAAPDSPADEAAPAKTGRAAAKSGRRTGRGAKSRAAEAVEQSGDASVADALPSATTDDTEAASPVIAEAVVNDDASADADASAAAPSAGRRSSRSKSRNRAGGESPRTHAPSDADLDAADAAIDAIAAAQAALLGDPPSVPALATGPAPTPRHQQPAPDDHGNDEERRQQAIEWVIETIEALLNERGAEEKIWGSMVKQTLKRRQPGFNEAAYGYRAFSDLLADAERRGLVQLERDSKSGGSLIRLL